MDCDVLYYYSISIKYHDLKKKNAPVYVPGTLFVQEDAIPVLLQYPVLSNTFFSEPETRQNYIQAAKSSEHVEYLSYLF